MSDNDHVEGELGGLEASRRTFIKRMAVGAAVAPIVTSFSMSGLSSTAAFAQIIGPNTSFPSNLP